MPLRPRYRYFLRVFEITPDGGKWIRPARVYFISEEDAWRSVTNIWETFVEINLSQSVQIEYFTVDVVRTIVFTDNVVRMQLS